MIPAGAALYYNIKVSNLPSVVFWCRCKISSSRRHTVSNTIQSRVRPLHQKVTTICQPPWPSWHPKMCHWYSQILFQRNYCIYKYGNRFLCLQCEPHQHEWDVCKNVCKKRVGELGYTMSFRLYNLSAVCQHPTRANPPGAYLSVDWPELRSARGYDT